MKTTSRVLAGMVCFCAASLLTTAVQATDAAGDAGKFYAKFEAGAAFQSDVDIKRFTYEGCSVDFPYTVTSGETDGFFDGGFPLPEGNYSVQPKIKFDPGFRFDVAVGYHLNDRFSVELASGLIYNSADELAVDISTPMGGLTVAIGVNGVELYQIPVLVNAIYQVPTRCGLKPYIGAGVGGVASFLSIDAKFAGESILKETLSDFTFGYQGMAGVTYQISDRLEVGVGYKLLGTLDHQDKGSKTDPTWTHSASVSLTWRF